MRVLAVFAAVALLAGCLESDPLALDTGRGGILGQLIETRTESEEKSGVLVPIADATVFVQRAGSTVALTTTNETGHFVIKNLQPRGYAILGGNEHYDAGPGVPITVYAGNYTRITIEADPL